MMKNTEELIFALFLIITVLLFLVIAFSYINEKQSKLLKQYQKLTNDSESLKFKLVTIILDQSVELENYELAAECAKFIDTVNFITTNEN